MSMAFEDPCFVYVGASGAVFGFIGEGSARTVCDVAVPGLNDAVVFACIFTKISYHSGSTHNWVSVNAITCTVRHFSAELALTVYIVCLCLLCPAAAAALLWAPPLSPPGLYLTDILLNFESMYKPLLRLALMLLSLGLTLGIEFAAAARNPLQ